MRTVCARLNFNGPRWHWLWGNFFILSSVQVVGPKSLWEGDGSPHGRVAPWLEGAEKAVVGEQVGRAEGEQKDGLEDDAGEEEEDAERVEGTEVEKDAEAEAEEEAPWRSSSPDSSLGLWDLSGWSTCAIWSLLLWLLGICGGFEHKWEEVK